MPRIPNKLNQTHKHTKFIFFNKRTHTKMLLIRDLEVVQVINEDWIFKFMQSYI